MTRRPHWLLALLGIVVVACGASSSPPVGPGGEPARSGCEEPANAARNELAAVIRANTACKVDADCTLARLAASCFDSCVEAVAVSGRAAVDAARARADAVQCKPFHERGCKLIAPPCAPPSPPGCVAGVCR